MEEAEQLGVGEGDGGGAGGTRVRGGGGDERARLALDALGGDHGERARLRHRVFVRQHGLHAGLELVVELCLARLQPRTAAAAALLLLLLLLVSRRHLCANGGVEGQVRAGKGVGGVVRADVRVGTSLQVDRCPSEATVTDLLEGDGLTAAAVAASSSSCSIRASASSASMPTMGQGVRGLRTWLTRSELWRHRHSPFSLLMPRKVRPTAGRRPRIQRLLPHPRSFFLTPLMFAWMGRAVTRGGSAPMDDVAGVGPVPLEPRPPPLLERNCWVGAIPRQMLCLHIETELLKDSAPRQRPVVGRSMRRGLRLAALGLACSYLACVGLR
jgi:hypothetical protein